MHQTAITAPHDSEGSLPDSYLPVPSYQHEYLTSVDFTVTRRTRFKVVWPVFAFIVFSGGNDDLIYSVLDDDEKCPRLLLVLTDQNFLMPEQKGFRRWAILSPGWPLKQHTKKPVMDKGHCWVVMTWYDNRLHVRDIPKGRFHGNRRN